MQCLCCDNDHLNVPLHIKGILSLYIKHYHQYQDFEKYLQDTLFILKKLCGGFLPPYFVLFDFILVKFKLFLVRFSN